MLFKILNVLGRRIPIGDHIGNTVQAAQMGKCPFVEFGFIKQHVNIFHILKEIIIQWKLGREGMRIRKRQLPLLMVMR